MGDVGPVVEMADPLVPRATTLEGTEGMVAADAGVGFARLRGRRVSSGGTVPRGSTGGRRAARIGSRFGWEARVRELMRAAAVSVAVSAGPGNAGCGPSAPETDAAIF